MTAHWGVPDPAAAEASEDQRREGFFSAYRQLSNRLSLCVNLPLASLDPLTLQKRPDEIGRMNDRGSRGARDRGGDVPRRLDAGPVINL